MITITNKTKCSGCHACVNKCPKKCIKMDRDEEGFLYPIVDKDKCINCGLCEKTCPIINPLENKRTKDDVVVYAAYSKDKEVRLSSSSGGIFTVIATHVIYNGGVVFGATFDDSWQVVHKCVDTVEGLEKLRGSKYVQSTIGETYSQVEEYLQEGTLVLFTGTPCQISGLYTFLKKDYETLITQDIICHGVPSPKVWSDYLDYRKKKGKHSKITQVLFRNKVFGWKAFSISIDFGNDAKYLKRFVDDEMMQAFLRDLCLRPSCYECNFKKSIRPSDFTLADFWGIQNVMPEMDDDKGISLMFVNSSKGKRIYENIKENLTYKLSDIETAIRHNPSMVKSVVKPEKRDEFMKDIFNSNFKRVVKKYLTPSFFSKIKKIVNKCFAKLKRFKKIMQR